MKESYSERIEKAKRLFQNAEFVIIGGGSGLSTAAGLDYGAARFKKNFPEFAARYGMTDMYSAGFYPFAAQEQKWAYWSRHIWLNRFEPPAAELYKKLFELVKSKAYFVVTTNVDAQFYKAGFGAEKIFAVQGDYGKFQCSRACCDRLYYNEKQVRLMVAEQKNCEIPSDLAPKCPVCGADMEVNIRKDWNFVEDLEWKRQSAAFEEFVKRSEKGARVLLEIGVGFNTPTIIRFPFENLAARSENTALIRINKEYPDAECGVCFDEDVETVISGLK